MDKVASAQALSWQLPVIYIQNSEWTTFELKKSVPAPNEHSKLNI
jgi:hypothetical protein